MSGSKPPTSEEVKAVRRKKTLKLAACPFCGQVDDDMKLGLALDVAGNRQVECLRCGARGPISNSAQEDWNLRSKPDESTRHKKKRRLRIVEA